MMTLMKKVQRVLAAGVLMLLCCSVVAAKKDPAPVAMLKGVSEDMMQTLSQHKGRIKNDMPFLEKMVRQKVVPHFTISTMSRSVVGRTAWKSASAAQKEKFKQEFTEMVVGIYAAPLADFDGDKVTFMPLRRSLKNVSRVKVDSHIIRKTGQRIPVNYRLVKIGTSWKVYDFSIEGVSMVQSFRSQFSSVLRQRGFAGLLKKVSTHNRKT